MPETATADAGYGSDENYTFLASNLITAYVKDVHYAGHVTIVPVIERSR